MKTLKFFVATLVITIFGNIAFAETKICIHSYYVSGLPAYKTAMSGHASISIETDGETTNKWGYYPKGLMTNFLGDGTLKPRMVERYESGYKSEYPTSNPKVHQQKHCKKIEAADVERARSLAEGYKSRYGDWTEFTNNCVIFAKYIYTQVTKDVLPLPLPQPKLLYTLLENADEQSKEDLAQVQLFEQQEAVVSH